LHYGNKGFVFSLDALIAIIVVIILLTTAYYYIAKSEENKLSNLQMAKIGSDILAVLDYKDMLKPSDLYQLQEIEDKVAELLPANYEIRIEIDHGCVCDDNMSNCNDFESTTQCKDNFLIGTLDLPNDRFIATGYRFFVRQSSVTFETVTYDDVFHYGRAKYWIWSK